MAKSNRGGRKGKGARTIKPRYRKNVADPLKKLDNEIDKARRELQILERGRDISVGLAKTQVDKLVQRKKYNDKIVKQRDEVKKLQRKYEDMLEELRKKQSKR